MAALDELRTRVRMAEEERPDVLMHKIEAVQILFVRQKYIEEKFPYDRTRGRAPPQIQLARIARVNARDRADAFYKEHIAYIQRICKVEAAEAPKAASGFKAYVKSKMSKSADAPKKHEVCDLLDDRGIIRPLPTLSTGQDALERQWDHEFEVVGQFKHKIAVLKAFLRKKEYEQRKSRDEQTDLAAKTEAVISTRNDLQAWIDDPDNGDPLKHVCFSRYFRDMEMMIFCNVLTSGSIPHFNPLRYKGRTWTHEQWAAKYLASLDLAQIENRKAEIKREKEATFATWDEVAARGASASAHNEYENYLFMDQFPENNDRGDEDLYQQNDVWRIDANERVLPPFKQHHHLYAPSKPSTSGFDVVSMIFAMTIAFVAGMVICCICWLWTALTGYFVASVAKTKATKRDEDDEESQYAVH